MPLLLDIISHPDESIRLKKEAIWSVSNLTEAASVDHIRYCPSTHSLTHSPTHSYLVGLGGLQTLCHALSLPDNEIVRVTLDGIIGVLEAGDTIASKEDKHNPFALMVVEAELVGTLH